MSQDSDVTCCRMDTPLATVTTTPLTTPVCLCCSPWSHLYSGYHTTNTNERNYQNLLLISFIILIFSCNQNTKTEYKIYKDGIVSDSQIILSIHAEFCLFTCVYSACCIVILPSHLCNSSLITKHIGLFHSFRAVTDCNSSKLNFIPFRNSNFPCLHIFIAAANCRWKYSKNEFLSVDHKIAHGEA